MSGVQQIAVAPEDDGTRLDRWFKARFPGLGHGRLEKLLRTGQIRLDGGRVKANARLAAGQMVRVPPLGELPETRPATPKRHAVSDGDAEDLRRRVLFKDDAVLILDKPAGLAVQGGSGQTRHLDDMLDALKFDAHERPRLVHRLDKDTSGTLVLARSAQAARALTAAFRAKSARKVYWAIVVGVPKVGAGRIDLALSKAPGRHGEKMVADPDDGQRATTLYRVVEKAGRRAAWLSMEPLTGRTHQLRVHCAEALGTPILGDGKYGGAGAYLDGDLAGRALHLHARAVRIPTPLGGMAEAVAPLPAHMRETWAAFGFDQTLEADPFFDWGE